MAKERLSKLQKWILINCYTGEIHKELYEKHFKNRSKTPEKLFPFGIFRVKTMEEFLKQYRMKSIQCYKFFGFECYPKNNESIFSLSWYTLKIEIPGFFSYFSQPKKYSKEEKKYEKQLKQKKKVGVIISRTLRNLRRKGLICGWDSFSNKSYGEVTLKEQITELKESLKPENLDKEIEKEKGFLVMTTALMNLMNKPPLKRKVTKESVKKKLKEKISNLQKYGFAYKYSNISNEFCLTEKGIEKAKSLMLVSKPITQINNKKK